MKKNVIGIRLTDAQLDAVRHEGLRNDRAVAYMLQKWVLQELTRLGHGDAVLGPRETITLDELEAHARDRLARKGRSV